MTPRPGHRGLRRDHGARSPRGANAMLTPVYLAHTAPGNCVYATVYLAPGAVCAMIALNTPLQLVQTDY
jgi:hypothetical protein